MVWPRIFKMESPHHIRVNGRRAVPGAATGVGGILRDFHDGRAGPIAVLDSLRFWPIVRALQVLYCFDEAAGGGNRGPRS